MKLHPFLLIPLVALTLCPALLADDLKKPDAKPADPVDARLAAIEQRLDRIEKLLSAPSPVASAPDEDTGRVKVTILGQVNAPGVYLVDPGSPIGTLVGLAHGYTRLADSGRVSISPRKGKMVKVNAAKDPRSYKLKSGDIITVPQTPW